MTTVGAGEQGVAGYGNRARELDESYKEVYPQVYPVVNRGQLTRRAPIVYQ
jgi:hypothetical protein